MFSAGALVMTLAACGGQPSEDVSNQPSTSVTLSPSSPNILVNGSQTFTATGGTAPYTFAVVTGGGSIDVSTGQFVAPASAGSVVIGALSSDGKTATTTINVVGPVGISPTTLSIAANATSMFTSSGGLAPFTFSIVSGGGSIGAVFGNFTAPASAGSVTVRVTDSMGQTADATVTVTAALAISPAAVSLASSGSQTFSANNGTAPYTYSVVSGGGSINSSSGAFTAPAGPATVVVRVTDNVGATSDATVTVASPVVISPASKTLAVNNVFTFSASGGQTPYTYSVFSGGGSINASTGQYTAPAAAGSATVRVTDALGQTSDASVTINAALAISPASVTLVPSQNQTFTASGGVSPYTYSVFAGGGSINSSTGAYTAPGSAGSATVRVTDSLGNVSDSTVTISNALTISPTSFTLAVNNTKTFVAAGGQAPYTYSKLSGTGSINSSSGLYTAPAAAGSAVVRVTDNLGNTADATITINAALAISPSTWTMETSTSKTFSASGGVSPYTYSVFAGGGSINSSTGAFTADATAGAVTVRVTDSLGNTTDATVTVVDAIVITPSPLYVLTDDTQTLNVSGGVAPYAFAVLTGTGSVDPGTGDYTAGGVVETASVRVTDSAGLTKDVTIYTYESLTISPTAITLAPDNTTTFSASGGYGTLTFSLVSGSGVIDPSTGDYTAPSLAGSDVVRVTDSIGNTADATITINGALSISPSTKKISINETFTFTATNGVPPYTYSVTSGGGTINPSTGVYTAPGASETGVVVEVQDSLSNTSQATVSIITPQKLWSGGYNNCVRYDDNSLKCWGDGASGKLLSGATSDMGDSLAEMGSSLNFVNVGTGRYVKDMALGDNHTCAILDNDSLKCWGVNTNGQLGLGDTSARGDSSTEIGDNLLTVDVGTGRTVKKVAVGPTNTCAILDNDTLKCWGLNTYGQLGIGSTTQKGSAAGQMGDSLPAVNLGTGRTAKDVTIGTSHTCVILDNNSLKCFGRSHRGQLGQGNTTTLGTSAAHMGDSLAVVNLGTGRTVQEVRAGQHSTCARLDDNSVKCWGQGTSGALGQGSTSHIGDAGGEMGDSLAATTLGSGRTATQISMKYRQGCAVLDNGDLKCWGLNTYGNLGKGNTTTLGDGAGEMGDNLTPISLNGTMSQFAQGIYHVCVMTTAKQVFCFGRASQGALGNGSTTQNIGDGANEMGGNLVRVNL